MGRSVIRTHWARGRQSPAGFSSEGLPIGLHIVGRKGGEETVIAASAAFERVRPWIQHRPPVPIMEGMRLVQGSDAHWLSRVFDSVPG
jgi:hypothetical protein